MWRTLRGAMGVSASWRPWSTGVVSHSPASGSVDRGERGLPCDRDSMASITSCDASSMSESPLPCWSGAGTMGLSIGASAVSISRGMRHASPMCSLCISPPPCIIHQRTTGSTLYHPSAHYRFHPVSSISALQVPPCVIHQRTTGTSYTEAGQHP
jgi:hypothetical protein